MRNSIEKLYRIANRKSRVIIGLMSGTSLDGLDIALCRVSGNGRETQVELLEFATFPYEPVFGRRVREVFARPDGELEKICLLHPWIAAEHAQMILQALQNWNVSPETVDLIASHGQTVYHAPRSFHDVPGYPDATLQLGDGDHLACATGIITISDFRQKHIDAGGEGAPLAPYGDYLLFSDPGMSRLLLNMGGISNFTFLPAGKGFDAVFSTDAGPGNTLMDAYVQKYFDIPYDADAGIAMQGQLHEELLQNLMSHPFFEWPFPKTTGPELFNLDYLAKAINTTSGGDCIPHGDVMHTLAHFTVRAILRSLEECLSSDTPVRGYVSGGGASNPLVMALLKEALPTLEFTNTSTLGLNPDAKEAVLFALLANEMVSGEHHFQGKKGYPWVSMGKISFPD